MFYLVVKKLHREFHKKIKELSSNKGRKLAVPPYFPPTDRRTLLRSVTGPPVFAYSSFSETTPKLPSTSFLSKGLSADEPFSLRIPDVYSSFSLSFTVFILFLYHQILFNFTRFVKHYLCKCSCIHTKRTSENFFSKVLENSYVFTPFPSDIWRYSEGYRPLPSGKAARCRRS